MEIITDDDFIGLADEASHVLSKKWSVLLYKGGGYSLIPFNFFRNWLDENVEDMDAKFYIGRGSGFGIGSIVKYDRNLQSLRVGRFVSGGLRLKFLLNGQHETRTISTKMFSICGAGLKNAPPPQYTDSIIKNDVWIGDEMMMLGGGVVENGCIIGARTLLPPNFRSEPYGIYAGNPARFIRFRFSEKIRERLLDLAWWQMPLSWIRENNDLFLMDLTIDEGASLEALAELKRKKV